MAKSTATSKTDDPDAPVESPTSDPVNPDEETKQDDVPAEETTAGQAKALQDEAIKSKLGADKPPVPDGSDALGPVTDAEAVALAYDGHPDPNQPPYTEPIASAPADAREDPLDVARRVIGSALNVNVAKMIHDKDTELRLAISNAVDGMSVHDVRIRTVVDDDSNLADIQVQLYRGEWQTIYGDVDTQPALVEETPEPVDA
jgi:hypothetical protein